MPNLSHYLGVTFLLAILPSVACALSPDDLFIVTNKNEPGSRKLAEYYCQRREVPLKKIIELTPTSESINRSDYYENLRNPLRKLLKEHKDRAKCPVAICGIPLRVGPNRPSDQDRKQLKNLIEEQPRLQAKLR
ncbi:MAG: hypothetical protein ACFCD0_09770 [Gemmataceae bacterium]